VCRGGRLVDIHVSQQHLADIVPKLARGIERDDITALMPKSWLLAHPEAAMAPLR